FALLISPAHSPHPHSHSFPTRRSSDLRLGHLGRASGILARRRAFEERLELRADQLGGKALPKHRAQEPAAVPSQIGMCDERDVRSEEHTSELQSHLNLVCRLLLEKQET